MILQLRMVSEVSYLRFIAERRGLLGEIDTPTSVLSTAISVKTCKLCMSHRGKSKEFLEYWWDRKARGKQGEVLLELGTQV